MYPTRISWNDPATLAIAYAQTIKILSITTVASLDHQATLPKKQMNIGEKVIKEDFYIILDIFRNSIVDSHLIDYIDITLSFISLGIGVIHS